uniref:uncharacterized protein CCDC162P n=1 Tax=Callithrix jacchus TaxID=9483 RepID=UPI00159F5F4F|nr:uncharacterized protein CCDC162P [Callithrix jacchus]
MTTSLSASGKMTMEISGHTCPFCICTTFESENCREPGPHHGRLFLGKYGKRSSGHITGPGRSPLHPQDAYRAQGHKVGTQPKSGQDWAWAHAGVARFAVLYDMWTREAALLENKYQLLDSYFEAYQHTLDTEELFALAQVMMDITYQCLRFDLSYTYFIKAYWEEFICLRLHLQLVRGILNQHIERPREYVQRLWQEDHLDNSNTFGLPLNIVCKQLISINNSHPPLKNVYLLEFHPSLSLATLIPRALEHLLQEVYHTCKPASASGLASLERHVLQLALDLWFTPAKPQPWYSAQLQKDAVKVEPGFPIGPHSVCFQLKVWEIPFSSGR